MSRVSYPGEGNLVWNGLTVRPDGYQVVTTQVSVNAKSYLFTTAIFPPDTGRQMKIIGHNSVRFKFEFGRGLERTPPVFVNTCRSLFTAGRQHEQAVTMGLPTNGKRSSAWERLLQDS